MVVRAVPMLDRDNSGLAPTWGATLIGATIKVCAGLSCSLPRLRGEVTLGRLSLDLTPMEGQGAIGTNAERNHGDRSDEMSVEVASGLAPNVA